MFKVPHLRNLYQKVGMFGMPPTPFTAQLASSSRTTPASPVIRCAASASCTTAASTRPSASTARRSSSRPRRTRPAYPSAGGPADPPPTRAVHARLRQQPGADCRPAGDPGPDQRTVAGAAHRSAHGARRPGRVRLVVKGRIDGRSAGFLYDGAGRFQRDSRSKPPITDAALRLLATTPGQELTYTCVPRARASASALTDGDGILDGDEGDARDE